MISARASAYAEKMTMKEPPLLRELRETTARELRYDDMLSGPVVGAFLNMLVHISKARTVLEIGTFTGYATLYMAMALPSGGSITTCESNEKYAGIARRFFQRFVERQKAPAIHLLPGPALQAGFPAPVDFIFLDADKENYPNYYKLLLPCLKPGGLMVIDNALWSGTVLEETEKAATGEVNLAAGKHDNALWSGTVLEETEKAATGEVNLAAGKHDNASGDAGNIAGAPGPAGRKARAIDHLNRIIRDDPAVGNVLLTVRDGLHVLRKCK